MTTRSQKLLTKAAEPIAQAMTKRAGSLKLALSAGLIALSRLSAEDRESAIMAATHQPAEADENYILWCAIKKIMATSSKSNTQIFKLMSEAESGAIQKIRQGLGPDRDKEDKKQEKKA